MPILRITYIMLNCRFMFNRITRAGLDKIASWRFGLLLVSLCATKQAVVSHINYSFQFQPVIMRLLTVHIYLYVIVLIRVYGVNASGLTRCF